MIRVANSLASKVDVAIADIHVNLLEEDRLPALIHPLAVQSGRLGRCLGGCLLAGAAAGARAARVVADVITLVGHDHRREATSAVACCPTCVDEGSMRVKVEERVEHHVSVESLQLVKNGAHVLLRHFLPLVGCHRDWV